MNKVFRGLVVGLLLVGTVACGSDDDDAVEGGLTKTQCIDTWVRVLNEVADDDAAPPTVDRAEQQLEEALGDDLDYCLDVMENLDSDEQTAASDRLSQGARVLVLEAAG